MITSRHVSRSYLTAMNEAAEAYRAWEAAKGWNPVNAPREKAAPRTTFGNCQCGAVATHKRNKECDPCFHARRARSELHRQAKYRNLHPSIRMSA